MQEKLGDPPHTHTQSCGWERVRLFLYSCGVRDMVRSMVWLYPFSKHMRTHSVPSTVCGSAIRSRRKNGSWLQRAHDLRGKRTSKERHGGLTEILQGVTREDNFTWGKGLRKTWPQDGVFKLYSVFQTDRDANGKGVRWKEQCGQKRDNVVHSGN